MTVTIELIHRESVEHPFQIVLTFLGKGVLILFLLKNQNTPVVVTIYSVFLKYFWHLVSQQIEVSHKGLLQMLLK